MIAAISGRIAARYQWRRRYTPHRVTATAKISSSSGRPIAPSARWGIDGAGSMIVTGRILAHIAVGQEIHNRSRLLTTQPTCV